MKEVTELPRRTRVAAYALCIDGDGRVLLARIAPSDPDAGHWTLPGGGLDFGEQPEIGVLRELDEETGLTGAIASLAHVDAEAIPASPERGLGPLHWIRIIYRVVITGGALRDEVDGSTDRAAWFTRQEAAALPLVELAQKALRLLDGA